MKKLILILGGLFSIIGLVIILQSCKATEKVTSKTGVQLWSENCVRCHNGPDPSDYSDRQWDVIGTHMKLRVNSLSDNEIDKIVEFLKSAN